MSPQKYGEYTITTLEEKNRDDFVQRVINVTDPKVVYMLYNSCLSCSLHEVYYNGSYHCMFSVLQSA